MQIATREDILACFRLLLGREPAPEELRGHLALVGSPLTAVVSSYVQSLEFRNRGLLQVGTDTEVIRLEGFSIYVAKDDSLIAPGIRAGYEPEVSGLFLQHLGAGCLLDIGANCGYFTFLAASRGRRVYAIEPLQRNLKLLHATIALNRFRTVKVIAAAASDSAGTLAIGASYTNGIVAELREGTDAAFSADYVAAIPVDAVIPPDERISVLKIDVEGHEYRAIRGASQTIRRCHPVIFSEFSPAGLRANSGCRPEDYLGLFRDQGYQISVVSRPEASTDSAIIEACAGEHHVDIVALPSA